jgi:phage tail sheath protein FI
VTPEDNAAIYFPRILVGDPLNNGQLDSFAPSGTIAGIFAQTDLTAGVWKAPAGVEAVMLGVESFSLGGGANTLTDADNERLNPAGINGLRSLVGAAAWCGARAP